MNVTNCFVCSLCGHRLQICAIGAEWQIWKSNTVTKKEKTYFVTQENNGTEFKVDHYVK